jgi:acetylornithine deacetylase/succinyl-diaminopimelate desuccinylase-like protein
MHDERLEPIYRLIDDELDEHVENIFRLIRQPSIAAENTGMQECAKLVEQLYREAGCQRTQIFQTEGQPVVYGELDSGADTTLIVYNMWDVKQVRGQNWTLIKDPFDPKIVDMPPFKRVIVGRGAINSKGPMQAFLNAVGAIRRVAGKLPVNLKFVGEGEEEIGSPHLYGCVMSNQELFRDADAVVTPSASQDTKGEVSLTLGCKGDYEFELECSGELWGRGPTKSEIHSSNAAWVESPVWRMIRALATMKADPQDPEKVTIKGFYDNVEPPTPTERELLKALSQRVDLEARKQAMGVRHLYRDLSGEQAFERLLYSPTLNIEGVQAGYTGPSFMTILPHKIRVKLEVRLVPNMSSDEVFKKVTQHLEEKGFPDIKIVATDDDFGRAVGDKWARFDPSAPVVKAVEKAYRDLGYDPIVWPRTAGTAPYHVFTNPPLKLPVVGFGLGHGGRAHAPDEYFVYEDVGRIKGLAGCEKSYVKMLYEIASAKHTAPTA